MSNHPKQKVLGKSFTLSMKKGMGHYFTVMLTWIFRLLIHLIGLVPLIFSFYNKAAKASPTLSLVLPIATLLLYLFFVLPLSFSKGQVLNALLYKGSANALGVFSLKNYPSKLKASFIQFGVILPWALPLLGLSGYLYYMTSVHQNGLDIIFILTKPLGPTASVLESVPLFVAYAAVLVLSFLFCAYGFLRNSSYPFSINATPFRARKKMVQALKGRRFAQLGMGIIQLIFTLPCLLAGLVLFYLFICSKYASLLSFLSSSLPIISFSTPWVMPLVIGCGLFTLLFLPFNKLFPAAFIKEARG